LTTQDGIIIAVTYHLSANFERKVWISNPEEKMLIVPSLSKAKQLIQFFSIFKQIQRSIKHLSFVPYMNL